MKLSIGLAQITTVPGAIADNLARHEAMVREACGRGADLVVFPELSLTGCAIADHMPAVARAIDSAELAALTALSRDVSIVVGFVERGRSGQTYNSLAYLEEGVVRHIHRKVYLVSAEGISERRLFAEGRSVRAFESRFGRFALINCEDAWHVSVPYLAVMDGAQLLLTCAATPTGPATQLPSDELWLTINRAYAVLFEAFNVFVNRTGTEGGLHFFGGSHVVDPRGAVVAAGPIDEETIVMAEIDLAQVTAQRFDVSYVRDERLALTARELDRLLREPGDQDERVGNG